MENGELQNEQKQRLFPILFFPILFILVIWLVKIAEIALETNFIQYGIYSRRAEGLIGILFYPLIHGDFNHLINNTIPLLILGVGIFYFYKPIAYKIYFWTYIMTGIWIWAAARESYHIGASGLVYGFASFIFFSGLIRQYPRLMVLSLLVAFLYGGMVWGIFPIDYHISWEGHLMGSIAGLLLAIYYKNMGPKRKQYSWEMEEEEENSPTPALPDGEGEPTHKDSPQYEWKIKYIYKPKNTDNH